MTLPACPAASRWLVRCIAVIVVNLLATGAFAQSLSDHAMVDQNVLMSGVQYSNDYWENYWEGTLRRNNGNVGVFRAQNVTLFNDYGITDRLNVLVYVPYVWTSESQGVLHDQRGFQDLTVGLKYRVSQTKFANKSTLSTFAAFSAGTPITNYTPDFQPLSIGLHSTWAAVRGTVNWKTKDGWFVTGSAAYTDRGAVSLDRPFFVSGTNGFISSSVPMPDLGDWTLSAGWQSPRLLVPVYFWHQDTFGGDDIRRQDAPLVSNKFEFSRLGASALWMVNRPKTLGLRAEVSQVVDGRNVGASTTLSTGIFYVSHF